MPCRRATGYQWRPYRRPGRATCPRRSSAVRSLSEELLAMAVHLFRNTEGQYFLSENDVRRRTQVLLFRAKSKQDLGTCVTMTPLNFWVSLPKQVAVWEPKDDSYEIHEGGWGSAWSWDDYNGDFYELSPLGMDLLDRIRSDILEIDYAKMIDYLNELLKLIEEINWFSNSDDAPDSWEECLTVNEKVLFLLEQISNTLSKYFAKIEEIAFIRIG